MTKFYAVEMTKYMCDGMTPQHVILSEVEGSPADWLRSLHCGRDDKVLRGRDDKVLCGRDDKVLRGRDDKVYV